MRGSDPDAAVYYLASMLEGGEDARFIARRMVDLRLRGRRQRRSAGARRSPSRPRTRSSTSACPRRSSTSRRRRSTSRARRSRRRARTRSGARASDVQEGGNLRPPAMLRDAHYAGAKKLGHGEGYVDPHTDPRGSELDYLPEELKGRRYYRPSGNGEEADSGDDRDGSEAPEFDLEVSRSRARAPGRLPRPPQRPARLPPVRLHGRLRGGGARPAGEPAVVRERRDRRHPRLVRHRRRTAGLEGEARAHATRSRPTSGRTARRRRPTASSTRRRARRCAARS